MAVSTVPGKENKPKTPFIHKKKSKGKPTRQKAQVLRAIKHREPKLVENVKSLLVIRGNKTNELISQVLTDLRLLKKPDSKMLSKKNDIHPFDDESQLEFLCQKNDTSLFILGSNTKKRPNNLILGRMYDGHLYDLMELGVENFKAISEFKCKSKKAPGSKPCFIFTGSEWETLETYTKLKNLLLDTFRGQIVQSVSLKGLDHVIVCTAAKGKAFFRVYSIDYIKSGTDYPRVELEEMGPRMDWSFRRFNFASKDLEKSATMKPKGLKPNKQKNVTRDKVDGTKLGRIHMDSQDLSKMQVRLVKALRSKKKDTEKTSTEKEKTVTEK